MSEPSRSGNRLPGRIIREASGIFLQCARGGITLDDALDQAPAEFRRTLGDLLFKLFRHRKSLELQLSTLIRKAPPPQVYALILAAAAQCRYQQGIAPESAINVAVDEAKNFRADKFVNAVLRNFMRQEKHTELQADDILPQAILNRWRKRFDREQLNELAALFLQEAPFSYRILPGADMVAESSQLPGFGPFRFAAAPGEKVLNSPQLAAGGFYIQDPAASMAVSLAANDAAHARNVLDLCSAPGGKTLMLGELCSPECQITAADISARRQERTRENFRLRNRNYQVIAASPEEIKGSYDIVLADVPCSNTGVFRRRPDALWRFNHTSFRETITLQQQILRRAVKLTAPGGILILSTCSIEPEENSGMVDFITANFPAMRCEKQQLLLPTAEHDGAFGAILHRRR